MNVFRVSVFICLHSVTILCSFLSRDALHSADYADLYFTINMVVTIIKKKCQSVCLSATRRYSVDASKHILKIFLLSRSHTILVFSVPNGMAIFRPPP